MGNQVASSASPVLSFQTAKESISADEYDRIRRAFSRFKKPYINFEEFNHHVLGGAKIPLSAQRSLFNFFSRGSDLLSFENLLCALVGICNLQDVQASFIEECPEFGSWGLVPPLLTAPVKDAYISFYEVMSYVTHLSVSEVMELEKVFATISDRNQCKISRNKWAEASGGCFPDSFTSRLFHVFDENRNDLIDFREIVCGLSAMCRGPVPSRLTFLAKLWDTDGDNLLNDEELFKMYEELNVPEVDRSIVKSSGDKAQMVDFTTWAMNNHYADDIAQMALEIGHICLGLRPENSEVRLSTVASFERRTIRLNLPVYNIVSAQWHKEWRAMVAADQVPPPVNNKDIGGIRQDDGPSAMVACLNAESACLRADITYNDFVAVPPALWTAFLRWHGSQQNLGGQFTRRFLPGDMFEDGKAQIELFPMDVLIMRHERKNIGGKEEFVYAPWTYAQVSRATTVGELICLCKKQLFLGEIEARLWIIRRDNDNRKDTNRQSDRLSDVSKESKDLKQDWMNGENLLLDDTDCTLYELGLCSLKEVKLLLELRNRSTGVWPEESRAAITGGTVSTVRSLPQVRPGAVGLVNLGNYCYRNAALQCLARVSPLTEFLLDPDVLEKLRRMDQSSLSSRTTFEYAMLLKEIWTTTKKNIAPIDFNNAVRDEKDFITGGQHDCQEFVNFLVEQLMNALCEKIEPHYTDDVPDEDSSEKEADEVKATKSWQSFMEENNSLVARLFAGQLKDSLVCIHCKEQTSKFQEFTSLSLPVGFDNVELFQVIVVPRDGSIPTRYGFRLPRDSTVKAFKEVICEASGISADRLTMLCMSNKGNLMRKATTADDAPITKFPSGARVYAMELPEGEKEWVVSIHRKLQYNYEPYLLGSTAGFDVNIFGVPLIVPCSPSISGREMYDDVRRQIDRFMDATPNAFSNRAADPCESSGYPFTLCIVDETLQWCGQCPPLKFCRGCLISPDEVVTKIPDGTCLTVDWIPTALYLRYNHSQETNFVDDSSVRVTWDRQYSPFSLEACMAQFSCPERVYGVDCKVCKRKTERDKVMTIWNLPRYLIIHLKRFEYICEENRVGKCGREVDFPLCSFDPSAFVDHLRGVQGGAKYECIAMANHYGQPESGHFLSYARADNGKWLLLNDCSVKEVNADEIDKKNAYLLFYERKDASEN